LKLLKAVELAIWRGGSATECVEGALKVLCGRVAEFEYLSAMLPGGLDVHAGQISGDALSNLVVKSAAGISMEAKSARENAFGSLHETVLEEAAGLLRKALRGDAEPGSSTAALHGGRAPFVLKDPAVTPIYQTTAYEFESVEQLEEFLSDQESGYIYSRWGNPCRF